MKSRLIKGNYNAVLNIAESIIAQDSTNAVAYFYRGFAYGLKAKEIESPWERTPLFVNSMQDFDTARKLMNNAESQQKEYADINNIIKAFWAEEHNEAIGYLTDDSLRTSVNNPELYAISHLKNATTIQPDSALSYIVLASTQFNQGDTPLAIETYEKAMDHLDKPKQDDYEFLISLYLNQNQYDKAYKLTKQALEDYPENTQFVQFLADIYIQKGEIDKAISIIENLIENEPDNPQYYRVLGTQVYQSVSSINSKLVVLYKEAFEMKEELRSMPEEERDGMKYEIENVRNQIEELQNESDELTAISIENLEKVVNLKPDDDYAHNILGIIHQNTAANLFERRNSFPVNSEPFQEVDQDAREALQCALNYYEKAAEINPAKTEFWESLFHVYDTLGMDEEAKVLKESGKF